jgi:uncharacterized membrane protein YGL010W
MVVLAGAVMLERLVVVTVVLGLQILAVVVAVAVQMVAQLLEEPEGLAVQVS